MVAYLLLMPAIDHAARTGIDSQLPFRPSWGLPSPSALLRSCSSRIIAVASLLPLPSARFLHHHYGVAMPEPNWFVCHRRDRSGCGVFNRFPPAGSAMAFPLPGT
jgi:hypothetical protein